MHYHRQLQRNGLKPEPIGKRLPFGYFSGMLPVKDAAVSSVSPHIVARETPLKPPDVSVPGPPWLTGAAGGNELKLMGQGAAQWRRTRTAGVTGLNKG